MAAAEDERGGTGAQGGPITFEIVRHRLSSINEEATNTLD